jgi:segregation and condensation protein B
LEDQQLKSAIEALLFIGGGPLSVERLKSIFEDASKEQIEEQLQSLKADYEGRGAGVMLAEVANGYQLATCPEQAPWVRKFKTVKVTTRLSRPALETLAIIAYKQPVTRPEIEAIRGVNIGGIVRNLMERRLVKIVGKKDAELLSPSTLKILRDSDKAMLEAGEEKWNRRMRKVLDILKTTFNYDRLYLGGGNAKKITFPLEENITMATNRDGIKGGARLWQNN